MPQANFIHDPKGLPEELAGETHKAFLNEFLRLATKHGYREDDFLLIVKRHGDDQAMFQSALSAETLADAYSLGKEAQRVTLNFIHNAIPR